MCCTYQTYKTSIYSRGTRTSVVYFTMISSLPQFSAFSSINAYSAEIAGFLNSRGEGDTFRLDTLYRHRVHIILYIFLFFLLKSEGKKTLLPLNWYWVQICSSKWINTNISKYIALFIGPWPWYCCHWARTSACTKSLTKQFRHASTTKRTTKETTHEKKRQIA